MTQLGAFALFVRVAAPIFALAVARRRAAHIPVALFLVITLISDWARWALNSGPLTVSGPYHGSTRALFHLEQALFLSWPIGVAALSVHVLFKRRAWPVLLAYLAVLGALVATYPELRGAPLRRAYLGVELACLTVAVGSSVHWWWRRQRSTIGEVTTLILVIVELTTLLGPYSGNLFSSWDRAQVMYATLYVVLTAAQGVALWDSSTSQSS